MRKGKRIHLNVKYAKKGFSMEQGLKHHISSVHEGKRPFKCNTCDRNFSQKSKLNRHVEACKSIIECDYCKATFAKELKFINHMKANHINVKLVNSDYLKRGTWLDIF